MRSSWTRLFVMLAPVLGPLTLAVRATPCDPTVPRNAHVTTPASLIVGCSGLLALCDAPRPSTCGDSPREASSATALLRDYDVQPKLLVEQDGKLYVTAVTEGQSRGGAILRIDGATGAIDYRVEADDPAGITLDSGLVYWSDRFSGTVSRMPKEGGPVEVVAEDQVAPGRMQSDGHGNVYWINTRSALMMLRSANPRPEEVVSRGVGPVYLAVDDDSVYFTNIGANLVMRVAKGGRDPTTLVSGAGAPNGLAVDATRVYWTEQDQVVSVDKSGEDRVVHVSGHGTPAGLVLDPKREGSYVYWVNDAALRSKGDDGTDTSGSVERACSRSEGATVVEQEQSQPLAIAAGACDVYWTAKKSVWRRPK